MMRVGITGNIGSGKTLVCSVFEHLGVPVYYSDQAGRRISQSAEVISEIAAVFGKAVLQADGQIHRKALSAIVFNSKAALQSLNAIIHPRVRADYEKWCLAHASAAYTLMESAILFEHAFYQQMDYNICVQAPKPLRVQRVMQRDGVAKEAVEARMANQWPEDKKIVLSDFVIYNDGKQMLIPQILDLHRTLLDNIGA